MKQFSFLIIMVALFLTGCTSLPDAFIYFYNQSNDTIYVANGYCSYPEDSTFVFKGESYNWDELRPEQSSCYPAEPGLYLNGYGGSWNRRINDGNGYVSFYVIDPSTRALLESSYTEEEYPVIVRYDLTINDLEELNYRVVYPPSEQMQSVHMWPPYSSFEE